MRFNFFSINTYIIIYTTNTSEINEIISYVIGEIRVGSRYQAIDIPAVLSAAEKEADSRKLQDLETLVWTPRHNLTDRQIDQFLVISRSVGTFARALDCSSSIKQPSLHMSAAAASRDITLVRIYTLFLIKMYSRTL